MDKAKEPAASRARGAAARSCGKKAEGGASPAAKGTASPAAGDAGRPAKQIGMLRRLAPFEGPFAVTMVLSWVFGALSGAVSVGMYVNIYLVADAVISSGRGIDPDQLASYGLRALLFASAAFGTYGLGLLFSHLTAFNTVSRMRIRLLRHLEQVPLGRLSLNSTGEIRKTFEKSVDGVEEFIAHQMPDLAQAAVMPAAFLLSMFFFDWRLALLCMLPTAVGFFALVSMLRSERAQLIDRYQEALGQMSASGVEYVRGIGVVKVFGQTVRSFRRFFDSIMRYKRFSLDYVLSMERPMAVYTTAANGAFLVLMPAGVLLYRFSPDPAQVLRSLVFFVVLMPFASLVMARVMDCSSSFMMASQALQGVEGLLGTPVQGRSTMRAGMHDDGADRPPAILPKSFDVVFRDLRFRYAEDASWALDGLSFTAEAKRVTALVGRSGSGKTTVANLLARFWDVDQGSVRVGGVDVADLPFDWWMRHLACVFQESQLLDATVFDNVAFCCEEATEESVLRALHEAQCDDILAKLPQGIHTQVGAQGTGLSGGERQRIALALCKRVSDFASRKNRASKLAVSEGLQEWLDSVKLVHASPKGCAYREGLEGRVCRVVRNSMIYEIVMGAFLSFAYNVLRVGIALVVVVGASLMARGQLSVFTFLLFLFVSAQIYDPVTSVAFPTGEVLASLVSAQRVREVEGYPPQLGVTEFEPQGFDLVFDHVSFSYDKKQLLIHDVSFTARQGQVTALVGPSGSGKSTISRLACRFWDVDGGCVSVGGVSLAKVDPETLLQAYSIVFQDGDPFSLGDGRQRVHRAVAKAGAGAFDEADNVFARLHGGGHRVWRQAT